MATVAATLLAAQLLLPLKPSLAATAETSATVSALLASAEDGPVRFLVKLKAQANPAQVAATVQLQSLESTPRARTLQARQSVLQALQQTAAKSQGPLLAAIERLKADGHISAVQPMWMVNAVVVTGDRQAVKQLAGRSDVATLQPDVRVQNIGPTEPTPYATTEQYTGDDQFLIHSDKAWEAGVDGSGIVIASLDTGVDWTHPALQANFRGYAPANPSAPQVTGNWLDVVNHRSIPYDDIGHGTHTMGTVLGNDPATGILVGTAPGAQWIAVKAFDAEGALTSWLLEAGQWLLAPTDTNGTPHPEWAPDIINNSWGDGPGVDEFFRPMVQAWVAAGIVPIFSAGNDGAFAGTVAAPANYPESIAVAAVDNSMTIAWFSSRGPSPYPGDTKPELSAPGVDVVSAWPGGLYASLSGTSMAAPHVTGVAALLLSAFPGLSPADVKEIMEAGALPLQDYNYITSPNNAYGYGLVQADVATGGLFSGSVIDSATGAPLAAELKLQPGNRTITSAATTGRFIVGLKSGTYTLSADLYGYEPYSTTIQITQGQRTVQAISLVPRQKGIITGTVTDRDSLAPIPGATVSVVEDTRLQSVQTDSAGNFTLQPFAGNMTLSVKAIGYRVFSQAVSVAPHVTTHVDPQLSLSKAGPDDWTQTGGGPEHSGYNASLIAPPLEQKWTRAGGNGAVIADGSAYIVEGNPYNGVTDIVALEVATGQERWRHYEDRLTTAPAYFRGMVVTADQFGTVYGIDTATGAKRWTVSLSGSTPSVPATDNDRVYLVASNQMLRALSPQGKTLWQQQLSGTFAQQPPAIGGGRVYAVSGGNVQAFDAATGQPAWSWTCHCTGTPAVPVLTADLLLFQAADTLWALDQSTGQVRWQRAGVATQPTAWGDQVLVQTTDRRVLRLRAADGRQVGALPYIHWNTPREPVVVANGVAYLEDTDLEGIDLQTGRTLWTLDTMYSQAVFGEGLILSLYHGTLTAFGSPDAVQTSMLTGRVTDAITHAPIAGAQVSMDGTARAAWSDSSGRFTLLAPSGSYTAVTRARGYQEARQSVNLNGTQNLDFSLPAAQLGSLSGKVVDQNGRPVVGATLTVREDATIVPTTTSDTGQFRIDGYGGAYTLQLTMPGQPAQEIGIQIPDGGSDSLTIPVQLFAARPDDWANPFGSSDARSYSESLVAPPLHLSWQTTALQVLPKHTVVGDGRLFTMTTDNVVRAFDLKTGVPLWTYRINWRGRSIPPAPVYVDGTLYVDETTRTTALDPTTGLVRGAYPGIEPLLATGNRFYQSGLLPGGSVPIVFASGSDASTGERLWYTSWAANHYSDFRFVVQDGVMYVTGDNAIVALDAATGAWLWRQDRCCTVTDTPVAAYGLLLTQSDHLIATDLRTHLTRWEVSGGSGAPVAANGLIFTANSDQVLALDPADGRTLYTVDSSAGVLAAAGPYLFGRNLTVVDLNTRSVVGSYLPGATEVLVAEGSVVAVGIGGSLSVLESAAPPPIGTLQGKVTGPAGEPVAGTVTLNGRVVQTDPADGRFTLQVPTGSYTLSATAHRMLPQSLTVTVSAGEEKELPLTLAAEPRIIVTGSVIDGTTQGPVGGALVALVTDPSVPAVRTNSLGQFQIQAAPGQYTLYTAAPGYGSASMSVSLPAGGAVTVPITLSPGPAGDCPSVRCTPARDGVTTGNLHWPLQSAWQSQLRPSLGYRHPEPVIGGGRLYASDTNTAVYAMDLQSGLVLWRTETTTYPWGDPASTYGDGKLFVRNQDGNVQALDAQTGTVLWTTALSTNSAYDNALLWADGRLYVGTNSGLVALDAQTGGVLWRNSLGWVPALAAAGSRLYEGSSTQLFALDAATGQQLWQGSPCTAGVNEVTALANAVLFYQQSSHQLTAYSTDGQILWQHSADSPAAVADGVAYLYIAGKVTALSLADGTKRWELPVTVTGSGLAPTLDGNLLLVGDLAIVDVTTRQVVWQKDGTGLIAPVAAGGYVVTTDSSGYLVAYTSIQPDLNGDGTVDRQDLALWFQRPVDLNEDSSVDLRDLWVIAHNIGQNP